MGGRFSDYHSDGEIKDIMERFIKRFPGMFEGFNVDKMFFITTKKKKSRKPVKLRSLSYPVEVFAGRPYIVEAFETVWKSLDQKKKNLAVFHIMCSIPDGGFSEDSKNYGKKLKPEIEMYLREFAAAGGVPNWMENPDASDPMERTEKDVSKSIPAVEAIPQGNKGSKVVRMPVTRNVIASVGSKDGITASGE